jgi:hypothetical protein
MDALDWSSMAPLIGDVTGPISDVRNYARYPEDLNFWNLAVSLAGVLPGVPSLTAGKKVSKEVEEAFKTPDKTGRAYKLFKLMKTRPGEIFPLFAKDPGTSVATPVGKWVPAENKPPSGLATRPGWHSGDIPYAPHLHTKEGEVAEDRVWAEVEYPRDVDWQPKAYEGARYRRVKEGQQGPPQLIPKTAELKEVPEGGFYHYKTNPNMLGEWIISGGLKVNRLLPDAEVSDILRQLGYEPPTRRGGEFDPEKWGFKNLLDVGKTD